MWTTEEKDYFNSMKLLDAISRGNVTGDSEIDQRLYELNFAMLSNKAVSEITSNLLSTAIETPPTMTPRISEASDDGCELSVNPDWPNSTNYNGFPSPRCFLYRFDTFRKAKLDDIV
jgi:hypothetical protein